MTPDAALALAGAVALLVGLLAATLAAILLVLRPRPDDAAADFWADYGLPATLSLLLVAYAALAAVALNGLWPHLRP